MMAARVSASTVVAIISNLSPVIVSSSFLISSRTSRCSSWMRRIVTSNPSSTGSSFSTGWMISSTFSYRFSAVIESESSLFFAASPRVVVSRVWMTSRARAISSAWVFFSREARSRSWRPGSSAIGGRVVKIALILPRTSSAASASSSLPLSRQISPRGMSSGAFSRWTVPARYNRSTAWLSSFFGPITWMRFITWSIRHPAGLSRH